MTSFIGLDPADLSDSEDFGPDDLQHIPDEQMDKQKKAMSANLMLRFGQNSFRDTYLYLRDFCVTAKDLKNIQCPSLALVGEGEGVNPIQQADDFVQAVAGPAEKFLFIAQQGADGHCQNANPAFSAAVSMDWLTDVLSA